jgi:hypothetical protein
MQVAIGKHIGYYRDEDDDVDIAFFYVPGYEGQSTRVSCEPVRLLQRIWSESYPAFLGHIVANGEIVGLNVPGEIIAHLPIAPAASGGGAFNENNELIGILSGVFTYKRQFWPTFTYISPVADAERLCPDGPFDIDAFVAGLNEHLRKVQ